MDKHDLVENEKIPTSKHKYLGIEIECIVPLEHDEFVDAIIKYNLEYYCNLGHDGSVISEEIKTGKKIKESNFVFNTITRTYYKEEVEVDEVLRYEPYELRVLCCEQELSYVLNQLNKMFKEINAKVNNSCGLHVHLDMRQRDPVMATKNLLQEQRNMFKMMPDNRKRNEYCKRTRIAQRSVEKIFKDELCDNFPRSAINISAYPEHRTIEIRMHEGTVDCSEISSWCKYLISVVDKKTFTKQVRQYVDKRINKFTK